VIATIKQLSRPLETRVILNLPLLEDPHTRFLDIMSKVVNFQQLRAQIGGRRDSTADCEVRKRNETSSSTKTTSAASTFTGPTSNEGMKDSATELPHPTLPTSPPPTTALVIELSVPQHAPAATAAPASVLVPTEVINLEGSLEGVVGSSGTESKTFC